MLSTGKLQCHGQGRRPGKDKSYKNCHQIICPPYTAKNEFILRLMSRNVTFLQYAIIYGDSQRRSMVEGHVDLYGNCRLAVN